MMAWVVIGFVLALAMGLFGLPYAVLFRPWRVKRLAYFLMERSPWYKSWVWRLMLHLLIRSAQEITAAMSALIPATKQVAVAFEKFGEAWRKAGA
jgi:hypothetical protein